MRYVWFSCGAISLILGVIGIFVPLLPTTPFVLLAAACFSKSSKKWHMWLLKHRIFGPMIYKWEKHGAISFRVKCLALSMLWTMISYPLLFRDLSLPIKFCALFVAIGVTVFIATRPSGPAV